MDQNVTRSICAICSERTGPPLILLAEDDPKNKTFRSNDPRRAGYQVLAAADGGEALRLARGYPGTIDLLLSDVVMPNMSGPELAGALEKERPGIRIVLMTGCSSR